MERYWFFTWRTYGTWLPGEDGFVGYYYSPDGRRVIENEPQAPKSDAIPALERYARSQMKGNPVLLSEPQSRVLLDQFHETAAYRGWEIDAVAILGNHIHIVFGAPGDPNPSEMLKTLKAYASRALNRNGKPQNAPRWFADGGSTSNLKDPPNRVSAIRYVRDQLGEYVIRISNEARELSQDWIGEVPVWGPSLGEPAT